VLRIGVVLDDAAILAVDAVLSLLHQVGDDLFELHAASS